MKMNLPLMKLTIRLLVLMIFFVIIFMISIIMYSARYWPDVYNYINANITIKRIPTISELNITVFEVDITTEYYTTDDFTDSTTIDDKHINVDESPAKENGNGVKTKRNVPVKIESFNDYSEMSATGVVVDYHFEDTTGYFYRPMKKMVKDLIDESKLVPKNYGDVEMIGVRKVKPEKMISSCHGNTSGIAQIYPWIATVFIKNDTTSNQFEYYCDGALLDQNTLITAARCVTTSNGTVKPDDMLVILGKRSLQSMSEYEKIVKINKVILHENFTAGNGKENDLAILQLEDAVSYSDVIKPACLYDSENENSTEKSATTAWNLQGDIKPVYFIEKNSTCSEENGVNDFICDSYGLDVALCPSYGGIYASRVSNGWYLRGIRTSDPTDRGICFNKRVEYTNLGSYRTWLDEYLVNKE